MNTTSVSRTFRAAQHPYRLFDLACRRHQGLGRSRWPRRQAGRRASLPDHSVTQRHAVDRHHLKATSEPVQVGLIWRSMIASRSSCQGRIQRGIGTSMMLGLARDMRHEMRQSGHYGSGLGGNKSRLGGMRVAARVGFGLSSVAGVSVRVFRPGNRVPTARVAVCSGISRSCGCHPNRCGNYLGHRVRDSAGSLEPAVTA